MCACSSGKRRRINPLARRRFNYTDTVIHAGRVQPTVRGLPYVCHRQGQRLSTRHLDAPQRAVLAVVEDGSVADPWLCIPAEWKLIAYRDALACRRAESKHVPSHVAAIEPALELAATRQMHATLQRCNAATRGPAGHNLTAPRPQPVSVCACARVCACRHAIFEGGAAWAAPGGGMCEATRVEALRLGI